MRLIDLDAKEPYLLDGRYAVGVLDNTPTVNKCDNCDLMLIEKIKVHNRKEKTK